MGVEKVVLGRRRFLGWMGVVGCSGTAAASVVYVATLDGLKCECGSHEFFMSAVQTFRPEIRGHLQGDVAGAKCVKCNKQYVMEHGAKPLKLLHGVKGLDAVKAEANGMEQAAKEFTKKLYGGKL